MTSPSDRAQALGPAGHRSPRALIHQRADEDLVGPGQRHQSGTQVDLEAVQIVDPPVFPLFDHHFTHMDADTVPQRRLVGPGRVAERVLEPQREEHGIGRPCEHQEERVAGRADLGGLGELGENAPNLIVVLLDASNPEPVAQTLLELGRPHQVGEHQRHQPGLMLPTEGLDSPLATGIVGLSIHGSEPKPATDNSSRFF
jgi:hypothetical protein